MSKYPDEDLKVIGQLYVEALAAERGADARELVRSIATCARAVQSSSRTLDEALLDALRGRKMRAPDSPEMLVRDMIGFLRATKTAPDEIEHFVERAQKFGFQLE